MDNIQHNTLVRLRSGGPQMIALPNDPKANLLGSQFIFCATHFKGKTELGYFRRCQLIYATAPQGDVPGLRSAS